MLPLEVWSAEVRSAPAAADEAMSSVAKNIDRLSGMRIRNALVHPARRADRRLRSAHPASNAAAAQLLSA